MKLAKWLICAVFVQFLAAGTALAQDHGTADQAKALVDKALAHIKAVGVEKACEEFSNKENAKWREKDLYVFVQKFDGNTLAHGGNKALVGKNMTDLKDANGQLFIKAMIDTARTKGSGWVDYMWTNPQTKKIEPKSSWVMKIADFDGLVGVGIYK